MEIALFWLIYDVCRVVNERTLSSAQEHFFSKQHFRFNSAEWFHPFLISPPLPWQSGSVKPPWSNRKVGQQSGAFGLVIQPNYQLRALPNLTHLREAVIYITDLKAPGKCQQFPEFETQGRQCRQFRHDLDTA